MALKRLENGLYRISNQKQAREAATMIEERNAMISEIEKAMEEEHDLQTMRREAIDLHKSLTQFMDDKSVDTLDMGEFRYQTIRPTSKKWNIDKLKAVLGKGKLLKVCKLVVDPDKLDDMVRSGKIDLDDIDAALEIEPKSAYIKRFINREAEGDEEADELRSAMDDG